MSGSIKWLRYQTDDGMEWGKLGDESNIENILVTDSTGDIQATDNVKYGVPSNIQCRFASFKSNTTVKVKKVMIPTKDQYDDLASNAGVLASRILNDADTGETFQLQSLTPERIRPIVNSIDTGLNEGDAT